MVPMLSWLCSAGCFALTLYLIRKHGLLDGGRPAWFAVLLLVPSWFEGQAAALRVDPRSSCALAFLIGFMLEPVDARRPNRWFLSDLCVFLLVIGVSAAQFHARILSSLAPVDQFRNFLLPYVVGRLFLRSGRDIISALPAFCVVISVLSVYAVAEALTRTNLIDVALGRPWHTPSALDNLEELRWGLKRAYATQTHPIYLGLTFALLLPFAVEAAVQSRHQAGPLWWRFVPLAVIAGVISTVSRAAQLCAAVVLVTMFFHSFHRWRAPIIILAGMLGIGFVLAREDVVNTLAEVAGEVKKGDTDYVQINGEWYEYTGTKHRDLLSLVYAEAIDGAGWLGYGGTLDRMPKDPDMDERFKSIDNHYLLFFLQYGYVGLVLFGALVLSVLANLLPPFLHGTGPEGRLAAGLFGGMLGCLVAMRTVWFAPDYAAVWLFCCGLSAAVLRAYRESGAAARA
jgi:hypothetical protein